MKKIGILCFIINVLFLIFIVFILLGFFDNEKYLNFRVSYSKKFLLLGSVVISINFLIGFLTSLNKKRRNILYLIIASTLIIFILMNPAYNKIAPW